VRRPRSRAAAGVVALIALAAAALAAGLVQVKVPPGLAAVLSDEEAIVIDASRSRSEMVVGADPDVRVRFAVRGGPALVRAEVRGPDGDRVARLVPRQATGRRPWRVRWSGDGVSRDGRYTLRVIATPLASDADPTVKTRRVRVHVHAFPVRGTHRYNLGGGRFGVARPGHTHTGQDLPAPCGTPLVAARGGTVREVGSDGGRGNYVVVAGRDTGLEYVYLHLSEPSPLSPGESVETGEQIGRVGNTGNSYGCHLHFELWRGDYEDGQATDPLDELEAWDRGS
jgi:murein DD-endopeptidase MepM/ murein hydrolase activator NlpD